ncbi:larval cuticle protein A2B-like [Tribolium madens]|uniref:larval cuticle protein A2B-like n=1 Tax=Tribolium madens TaxID=41895 RepID=UPI001CF72A0A|nr:larval cuticle protein A2B-like [Tribolium madens]
MTLMFFIFTTLIALARGGLIAAPVAPVAKFVPSPLYSFAYDVKDSLTGDFKSQVETRSGGVVRGQYSVIDPDGTKRIVDYTADPIHGFNAVVRKAPIVNVVPPVVAPAPVVPAPTLARVAPVIPRPVSFF